MTGLFGAAACAAAGALMGLYARESVRSRYAVLRDMISAMQAVRLLISQRRLSMPEVLAGAALCAAGANSPVAKLFGAMSQSVRDRPLCTLLEAYELCRRECPMPGEAEECVAAAFGLLGGGTAEMREMAAADCARRLAPICESAREKASGIGDMYLKLGLISGVALGILVY